MADRNMQVPRGLQIAHWTFLAKILLKSDTSESLLRVMLLSIATLKGRTYPTLYNQTSLFLKRLCFLKLSGKFLTFYLFYFSSPLWIPFGVSLIEIMSLVYCLLSLRHVSMFLKVFPLSSVISPPLFLVLCVSNFDVVCSYVLYELK